MIRTGYANTWYLVRRFIRVHTSVRNYKCRSNILKDTKRPSHFRTNWYTIKKTNDERAARPPVSLQMRNACEARAGFRYPAQTRVPTRCKRGRWARSRQALLVYVLQQHSVLPGTIHCCCGVVSCVIRPKSKQREVRGVSL